MASLNDENTKGQPCLPFHVGYLPKAVVAKAEKELGETEEVRAQTLAELRKLIEREPNFKTLTDDVYLLQFLRPHKFSVKRAFEQMQTSFREKKNHGNLYDKCDPESLIRTYGLKTIFCLPYRDEDGAVIFIVKMSNWDPDVSCADEFVVALTCAVFLCTADPVTQVCGIRFIIDVGGMRLKHVRSLAPNCLPLIANALKVHFHGHKLKELHEFIPKEIIPVELGGDNADDVGSWFNVEAEKFLDRYAELCMYGYK